eukprot:TRINITY_DN3012_c0_g1_i2.p1 TRINITY_DN3012_c0_g1~~TRINITY_DN3012_c0_g1_i2.p1  ORF type:complete len:405 (-),score=62.28 TRINITY_DN3012_c0_g1_i2:452-1666(-)
MVIWYMQNFFVVDLYLCSKKQWYQRRVREGQILVLSVHSPFMDEKEERLRQLVENYSLGKTLCLKALEEAENSNELEEKLQALRGVMLERSFDKMAHPEEIEQLRLISKQKPREPVVVPSQHGSVEDALRHSNQTEDEILPEEPHLRKEDLYSYTGSSLSTRTSFGGSEVEDENVILKEDPIPSLIDSEGSLFLQTGRFEEGLLEPPLFTIYFSPRPEICDHDSVLRIEEFLKQLATPKDIKRVDISQDYELMGFIKAKLGANFFRLPVVFVKRNFIGTEEEVRKKQIEGALTPYIEEARRFREDQPNLRAIDVALEGAEIFLSYLNPMSWLWNWGQIEEDTRVMNAREFSVVHTNWYTRQLRRKRSHQLVLKAAKEKIPISGQGLSAHSPLWGSKGLKKIMQM